MLAWTAWRSQSESAMAQPQKQAQPEDDLIGFTAHTKDGHPGVICERDDHHQGYVYTPHRYPRAVGGEISNAIHYGWSAMRVPRNTPDAGWIVSPPSEVMF